MKPRPASAPYQYRSFRMAAAVDALDETLRQLIEERAIGSELRPKSAVVRVGTLRGYPVYLTVEMAAASDATQTVPYEAVS